MRCGLAQNPAVTLRLAVACLIGNATNRSGTPTGPRRTAPPSRPASSAARRWRRSARRGGRWQDWLADAADGSGLADTALAGRGYGEGQTAETFARLLEMSDERVLKVLAVVTAETLVAGGGLAERLGELLQIDLRAYWQPDETFFDLLTDKDALARIAAEVGAAPSAKATGKELRAAIRRRLKGEGCQPVENWLPRYLEFPTRGYTGRALSRPAPPTTSWRGAGTVRLPEGKAPDETGFEAEDADETGTVAEWDEAA